MIVGKAGAVFGAAMIVVVAMGPAGAPAAERSGAISASAVAAASRCNPRVIDDYQGQIRNYDAHPARGNSAALNARLGDIADILAALNEEHGVLDSMCATDTDKAPLFAQLNATTAWALALESDIAAKLNASCPPAAKALPSAMLAQAWLALAATVNDEGGNVPKSVAEVLPKVQTRAAALGLALPAYSETSAYWRDQIADQAKQAVAICPTPVPPPATPTPSPYPSPPQG
ncbi:MAG: hypothetical protein WB615_01115 [Candidatus Tumulicola sp.]